MIAANLNSRSCPKKQILILKPENIGKQQLNDYKMRKTAAIKIIRQYQPNYYDKNLQKIFNIQSRLQYALFNNKMNQKNIYFSLPQQLDVNSEIQEYLKALNEQVKKDVENNRYRKYSDSIKWLTELSNNQYSDFLLQLNSLRQYKEQIKSGIFSEKDGRQPLSSDFAILFQQNFNPNCNRLLHVCSVINKLEELQFAKQGKPYQPSHNVYYINLTFQNSQSDLQFWSYMNQKQKQNNKLIILEIVNEGESLKSNTSSEIIIPLVAPQNNCFSKQQIQIIYNHLISPHLISDNDRILYVEISSSDLKIDYEAYEFLFDKFSQLGQVIVLVKIPQKINLQELENDENDQEEIELEQELFSIANACVLGLQGIKKQEILSFSQDKQNQLVSWLLNMQALYQKKNSTIENLLLYETLLNSNQEQQNNIKEVDLYSFYNIFQGKAKWCTPRDQKGQIIQSSSFNIFHQTSTIVIYDKDPYWNSFERVIQEQEYQQINLQENNLKDPSIMIINKFMIFAYGFKTQGRQEFQDIIQIYDTQTKSAFVLRREEFEINSNFVNYFKKESQENIINRIQSRIGQQICSNNCFQQKDEQLSVILFGGEDFKSNKIMNIIEFIFINLKTKQFFSRIIDICRTFLATSLRPWPNQIILEAEHKKNQLFLALYGNQSNKLNYYSFPINLNHKEFAQLFILTEQKLSLQEIKIDRSKSQIQDIESLFDKSRNWWLFEESDDYLLWKILITRAVKFKKFNQDTVNYMNEKYNINTNQQSNVCFEVTVKLNIPNKEDYKNCTIDMNCQVRSIKKTE